MTSIIYVLFQYDLAPGRQFSGETLFFFLASTQTVDMMWLDLAKRIKAFQKMTHLLGIYPHSWYPQPLGLYPQVKGTGTVWINIWVFIQPFAIPLCLDNPPHSWWFRNPANQLRLVDLVVYPIIYRVLYIPGAGFHQQYVLCFLCILEGQSLSKGVLSIHAEQIQRAIGLKTSTSS